MEILIYFFRSFIVLLIFYSVYQLLLKNDAHYSMHRWFLFMGLVFALFLPLAEINYTVIVEKAGVPDGFIPVKPSNTPHIVQSDVVETSINWVSYLSYFYMSIVLLFIVRLLVHVVRMVLLAKSSSKQIVDGITVCINAKVDMPFVFGRRIFLKDSSYLKNENAEVLTHEKVHLIEQHWIDVFISELFIVTQWFNPLAWFYARIVKQNLEFIADRGVLNKGFQMDKYIQHIICETMGAEASVLANHFRFSQNKRRLKMMKNVRKSKWRLLKLLLVLPLLGSLLWAFSEPVYEYSSNPEELNDVIPQEKKETFIVKGSVLVIDTMKISNEETGEYFQKVTAIPLTGSSIVIKGTTTGTIADMDGCFEMLASEGDILVVSFVGYNTKEVKVKKGKKLYVELSSTSYELDPTAYREKYKGKMTPPPPPPPPGTKKKKIAPPPPPPPPPVEDGKPVFYVVEDMPSYKGGMDNYFALLYTYIEFAKRKENLKGKVNVQFTVGVKGELNNISALNMTDMKEAKHAVRIVSELKNWKPGMQRGKPVSTTLVVPVEFD